MKKFAIAAFLAIVALVATFALTNSAQAYPDVVIQMDGSPEVIYGGEDFTVSASANVSCGWEIDWNDESRAAKGTAFETTFTAPDVEKITKIWLHGSCAYADPAATARTVAEPVTREQLITILPTVAPAGQEQNSASLAGTGGPDRAVLLSGIVLLLAGATVAMVARRRAEHAEFSG